MTTRARATVTWPEANARRMVRQHLYAEPAVSPAVSPVVSPADAVGAMLGAHAQVLSAAELSVGWRREGG